MSGNMLQYALPLGTRADSLSLLQNLGQPLSRVDALSTPLPEVSPVPGLVDFSLVTEPTRTKKCCKGPLPIERISSEVYPIDAEHLRDLRAVKGVFGAPSRFDGRDPVAYRR